MKTSSRPQAPDMTSGFNAFGKNIPEHRIEQTREFIKTQIGIEDPEHVELILMQFKVAVEQDLTGMVIGVDRSTETHSVLKNIDETSRYMILAKMCTD